MTELMKRYEAETGKDRPTVNIYSLIDWYEAFSAWLEDQLRWRPVSEKPKKAGEYFVRRVNEKSMLWVGVFSGKRWDIHNVSQWLPIPPAPEGE